MIAYPPSSFDGQPAITGPTTTTSPRMSCPRCQAPYMVAALDAEAEGRALADWRCGCRLADVDPEAPTGTVVVLALGVFFVLIGLAVGIGYYIGASRGAW